MTVFEGHQHGAAFCVYYECASNGGAATHSPYVPMAMNTEHDV